LRAVRFDPERLEVRSDPVPVLDGLLTKPQGSADYTVSRDGVLVYVALSQTAAADLPQRTLVWVGRDGREEPVGVPPRAYQFPRLSPEGNRIALDIRDQQNDVWIWDIGRKSTQGRFRPSASTPPAASYKP
jgi:serine/threonine-protein kinase